MPAIQLSVCQRFVVIDKTKVAMASSSTATRTISIQVPEGADPGDVLSFVVDGTELDLQVPEGSRAGDVFEIQVGSNETEQGTDEAPAAIDTTTPSPTETSLIDLPNGTRLEISLSCPESESATNADEKKEPLDGDGTHAMVWASALEAIALLDKLEFPSLRPKNVLELGSGTGVFGLAYAATLPLVSKEEGPMRVVLTDRPQAVPLLLHNIEKNSGLLPTSSVSVTAKALEWGQGVAVGATTIEETKPPSTANDKGMFDLILGSDLLYNIDCIPLLLQTIQKSLSKDGAILLATRWRKPELERAFFRDSGLSWTLLSGAPCVEEGNDAGKNKNKNNSSSNASPKNDDEHNYFGLPCQLSWQDFGNPESDASNLYLSQTMVSVRGSSKLLPLSNIQEAETTKMTKDEYKLWERCFVQIYVGRRNTQDNDDPKRTLSSELPAQSLAKKQKA